MKTASNIVQDGKILCTIHFDLVSVFGVPYVIGYIRFGYFTTVQK